MFLKCKVVVSKVDCCVSSFDTVNLSCHTAGGFGVFFTGMGRLGKQHAGNKSEGKDS